MKTTSELRLHSKNPLAVARDFQRQIAKLQAERERLYRKALRALKVEDNNAAWDYLMGNQCGYNSTFKESSK